MPTILVKTPVWGVVLKNAGVGSRTFNSSSCERTRPRRHRNRRIYNQLSEDIMLAHDDDSVHVSYTSCRTVWTWACADDGRVENRS